MADVDNNESTNTNFDPEGFKGEVNSKLEAISELIARQNEEFRKQQEAMIALATSKAEPEPEYLTAEEKRIKALEAKLNEIETKAPRMAEEAVKRERQIDSVINSYAAKFPEIVSDQATQQEIIKQHAKLPNSMKDTAEGYELAVTRAITAKGLSPKSKRGDVEPDVSAGASRGSGVNSGTATKKPKVSEKTLLIAQLLGRDVNDPKVLKGLEEAQNRKSYNKYE